MNAPFNFTARIMERFKESSGTRADYDAAKTSRFKRRLTGTSAAGSGADYHYRSESDFLRMIEQAREFDRNDELIGQGVTRVTNNIMQGGIQLDLDTGDEDLNTYCVDKWNAWCEDPEQCHRARELTFTQIAKLAFRSSIVDGDALVLATDDGSLQPIEAHRIMTPRDKSVEGRTVFMGVEMGRNTTERIAYHVADEDLDPSLGLYVFDRKFTRVEARQSGIRVAFHIYNPQRFSQTRGISALAPVMNTIGMLSDIQFATLVKQQAAAIWALIKERPLGFENAGDEPQYGEQTTDTRADGTVEILEGVSPGMMYTGAPGEVIKGFAPQIPGDTYKDHVMMIMTIISVNLGIPVHVLLLDPSNTNFSGWRGAIDQARIGFTTHQSWMTDRLYAPAYRWKMTRWMFEDDYIAARVASDPSLNLFRPVWSPPRWPYIDPSKDANAETTIITNRLNSRRGVLRARGLDLDRVDREVIADNRNFIMQCIEAEQEILGRYPDCSVTWRDIAELDSAALPQGGPVQVQPTIEADDDAS